MTRTIRSLLPMSVRSRSAATNAQGNLMLRFAAPPPEIKQVDILRAAHSDHGRGVQHYVLVEANVPVSELIG